VRTLNENPESGRNWVHTNYAARAQLGLKLIIRKRERVPANLSCFVHLWWESIPWGSTTTSM